MSNSDFDFIFVFNKKKITYFICPFNNVLIWTLSLCNLCSIGLENKVIINNKLLLSNVEMFTYNLFVTFLTSKDISRIITTRSLIDIDQNILCNKGTWIYVFVHTNHLYDVSLYVLNNFFSNIMYSVVSWVFSRHMTIFSKILMLDL